MVKKVCVGGGGTWNKDLKNVTRPYKVRKNVLKTSGRTRSWSGVSKK